MSYNFRMTGQRRKIIFVTVILLICALFIYIHDESTEIPVLPYKPFNLAEIISIKISAEQSVKTTEPASDDKSTAQAEDDIQARLEGEELNKTIDEGDICKLTERGVSLKDAVLALAKAPDKIRVAPEEDSLLEKLFGSVESGENSGLILDFYNALLFADLLNPVHTEYKDEAKAEKLFASLEERDPTNGAYYFFRAYVLKEAGAAPEIVKAEFVKSFNCTHFDSFVTDVSSRIFEKGFGSAVHFWLAREAISKMPFPNYTVVYKLLGELIKTSDAEFAAQAAKLGQLLMQPGLRADGKYEFTQWLAMEYLIGSGIIKKAAQITAPGEPPPAFESFRNLMNRGHEENSKFEVPSGCNRDDYEKQMFETEQNYLNFLKATAERSK